ncbi:MAG: sensor domain-containing diguanylate cyclase [Variovorax paradoxus]|nr:MAG: sensor domain-containing diguanylate cyclase [Variovorax paradoxus]PZQ00093.1 MAG: sensor domain-containing diguanylate cyclase [Variovorax paradoxus]
MPHTKKHGVQVLDHGDTAGDPSAFSALDDAPRPSSTGTGTRAARWLIGFALAALVVANGWLIVKSRRHVIEQTHAVNTNLARAVSEQVELSLAQVDQLLDTVVEELERADVTSDSLLRLQPVLVNHVARTEQLSGMFVYDAKGAWIATSEAKWDSSFNDAQAAYFVHHRESQSALARVGAPVRSRSSDEWVIPVSRRINDAEGRFAGVALATLSVDYYSRLLGRFNLGEGAITLTIASHYVARHPIIATNVGQPATVLNPFVGPAGSGFGSSVSPIDGVDRFFSFERARSHPSLVIVASGREQVLAAWRTSSWLQSLWVLLLCLALAIGLRLIQLNLRYRIRAEEGLRDAHDALAKANVQLQRIARLDSMTGLPNRGTFDRRFERAFRSSQREQEPLSIIMVDVDHFKQFNDTYGHMKGDNCLIRVAAALRTVVRRPEDLVARYGGEEMALMLRQTGAAGAASVAEAARRAVRDLAIEHAGSPLGRVTVSLGVASLIPGRDHARTDLLMSADAALYDAKRLGRDRVHVAGWDSPTLSPVHEHLQR